MTDVAHRVSVATEPSLASLLAVGGLRSVFQPIVCLDRLSPVGVEALVRGPAGSALESPDMLFAQARRDGSVARLDWASRRVALEAAATAGLSGPASLFLNAEPEGLGGQAFPGLDELADRVAANGVQVVLEITERALTHDPGGLLKAIRRVREMGWRVAIDDVGAERASLALLPFLAPDVVKLDLRLIQQRTTVEIAEIVNAVLAHSERTGAVVLAEGIETERQLDLARSMGASLGQGWFFGRPGPLSAATQFAPLALATRAAEPLALTPWSLVADDSRVRTAGKSLLVATSKTLERQALASGEASVIIGAFQHRKFFTADTRRRYEELAGSAAFTAALAAELPDIPAVGVRGCAFSATDPLALEWDVVVVGPYFAGALLAREHASHRVDQEPLFDYLLTYDRERVLDAARSLMSRVSQAPV